MAEPCLKLTVHAGERDRAGGAFLADALAAVHASHRLRISLVLRGVEGFGLKHRWHTDRLLSLSEDLPLVSVAVDRPERIRAALADVERLAFDGLVTLERARVLEELDPAEALDDRDGRAGAAAKLTVYLGRGERAGGRPAHVAVVDALHAAGLAGATVLLGVDGTVRGQRRRARFLGRNAGVPLMVIGVGDHAAVAAALPRLAALLAQPLVTLERVQLCKRDGARLAVPAPPPAPDPTGLAVFQKLSVHLGEHARRDGRPLHEALVRGLRAAGAAGATTLRGVWGFHGDHAPHGDVFWELGRRVPVLCMTVDTPAATQRAFEVIDGLTDASGLVTCELVPAFRATAGDANVGGLALAAPPGAP